MFRKAAYLCSVSPGASLEISETDTEVLDKEMVKYCRGPACPLQEQACSLALRGATCRLADTPGHTAGILTSTRKT